MGRKNPQLKAGFSPRIVVRYHHAIFPFSTRRNEQRCDEHYQKALRLQCVVGTFSAYMTMSEESEFLIDQRRQFRERSIVPVTRVRQELGHSLRGDRRRIHNLFFIPYRPKKFLRAEASPKKSQFR